MGNAVTCSIVDVVGTVTVTQADGQTLQFVQPICASQVKKLYPGNWLVHYVSMQDAASQKHHGRMSMLQGDEELRSGETYFLLPIPSHFRKQVFAPELPKHRISLAKSLSPAAGSPPPLSKSQQPELPLVDISTLRTFRKQEPTPVFTLPSSPAASAPVFSLPGSAIPSSAPQKQGTVQQPSRPHKRCSKRHRIHVLDWQPTLMTIEESY